MNTPSAEPPQMPRRHRMMLWCTFWLVFVGSPVLLFALTMWDERHRHELSFYYGNLFAPMMLGSVFAAAAVSGFLFAKLHCATDDPWIGLGCIFTCVALSAYFIAAFFTLPFLTSIEW